ncbi:GHKL domain-containing protein [Paenibacillus sp. KQZ6P-2]|uniref:GHKL domain-containing protein n=1 Tax=Paenibacillus mangrovi TaxID=2931978 RepID=A0A9X1WKE6_9BACL|nr:GHKL domain-containing protein [Paenibacillus mangrovi]MCJ8010942.1 GHKL domain-containing protein [Paenibacillus mangrovi]
MGQLIWETALDVLSILLLMQLAGRTTAGFSSKVFGWGAVIFLFCLFDQTQPYLSGGSSNGIQFSYNEILPVATIPGLIGLLFLTLLINSFVFKRTHVEIIFITMLGFSMYLLLRLFVAAAVDLFAVSTVIVSPLTLLLTAGFYGLVKFKFSAYLSQNLNQFMKLLITAIFIFLLYMILSSANPDSPGIHPFLMEFMVVMVSAILGWLFYEQRRAQVTENRIKAIEKYIPIIDELVAEVRARQHEFSNKLLAISSILQSAEDMETAREQVSMYVDNVKLTDGQHELLNMDHKVIAGFLYTKMKRAEQLKMNLCIERSVPVSDFPCEDHDLIEVLGILIDNAMEACYGGDTITVNMLRYHDRYELTVSNPAEYMDNTRMMQLFKLGYSTKSTHSKDRGYGLYNVQQIAKQYNGKIIARNDQKHGNKLTIGIQF